MVYLSEQEISKQESLTPERFEKLYSRHSNFLNNNRPKESLIELINWTKIQIGASGDSADYASFIHNTINMDGSFLVFCEKNDIKTQALHTDAITSWQTNHNDEHFISVGVFKISKGDLTFYHCGMFHKGNQNEDEVSFFCLVPKDKYEQYINLRNQFSDWQTQRDRDSKEIEVIGGEPIPYDTAMTWDDVFLPNDIKKEIVTSVEGFLKSKHLYEKLNVPWKNGFGFWGDPGNGKTLALRVIMSQYPDLKPVTISSGHPNPDELLASAFDYAEEHGPALLFFDDFQELVGSVASTRNLLQLMDGIKKRSGVLTIVTGNDSTDLHKNLKSRPGRFDKFFEFPLPDNDQTVKYLSKFFGTIVEADKIKEIAKSTVEKKFSYTYLREVYLNSVYIAISFGREVPIISDIDKSLAQVIKEKRNSESNFTAKKRKVTD